MQIEGIDEIDNKILEEIKDNARLTYKEIVEAVGISRVSVKNRMDAMQGKGIIKGFVTVIDPTNVPVILGYSYKKFFSLGDTFEGNYLDLPIQTPNGKKVENMTFKVIGFIAEGQTFFSVGGSGPYTYDTYAVIPYIYKLLDYWFDIYEEYPEYFYNEKSIVIKQRRNIVSVPIKFAVTT